MRYFIGHLIEGGAADYYKNITADLTSCFGIKNLGEYIPLYLTLKAPFDTNDVALIERVLGDVAIKEKTTPFVISGFEKFGPQSRTIFLGVENTRLCRQKPKNLSKRLPRLEIINDLFLCLLSSMPRLPDTSRPSSRKWCGNMCLLFPFLALKRNLIT